MSSGKFWKQVLSNFPHYTLLTPLIGCLITHGFITSGIFIPVSSIYLLKSWVSDGENTDLLCSSKALSHSGMSLRDLWASKNAIYPPIFGIVLACWIFQVKTSFPLL